MKTKLILLLCLSLFKIEAMAQDEEREISLFNNLYIGVEVGKTKGYDYFAQGGVWIQLDHDYFKIKGAGGFDNVSEEQKKFHKGHEDCDCLESREITDVCLIYGKSYSFLKRLQIQFGSGVSMVTRNEKDVVYNSSKYAFEPDAYQKRVTVGLPAEIKCVYQFKRFFALNAGMHVNANSLKSYSALSVGLTMGMF